MDIKKVNPWKWQDAFGISQAIEFSGHNRVLVCSGQTSVDDDGAAVHAGDIGAQMGKALDNLEKVLAGAGMTLGNVVRLNIYTTDVNAVLPAWGNIAGRLAAAKIQPACTLLGVASLFEPEIMVELEATAVA